MLTQGISVLTIIIIAFIVFDFVLDFILSSLNSKTWDLPIPKELEGIYDEEQYAKARQYHKAKEQLSSITTVFSTLLIIAFLAFKGFALVHIQIETITSSPVLQALLFFGAFSVVSDIIGLPFELYGIFGIEEKFGFNKMTWKTYIADKLKGIFIRSYYRRCALEFICLVLYAIRKQLLDICLDFIFCFYTFLYDVLHQPDCSDI
jgi:STE24 endopeptidase